jgi:hypothetical protein
LALNDLAKDVAWQWRTWPGLKGQATDRWVANTGTEAAMH